jgi:CheY-like chemotaxis protein
MSALSHILMLEDDPDDRFITETTLGELGHNVSVTFVRNSDEFLAALERGPRPRVILVDQACVSLTALELLQRLKSDERFRAIPVVVLGEMIPYKAGIFYACGAASYLCKPDTPEATREKIDLFFRYWLSLAESPE